MPIDAHFNVLFFSFAWLFFFFSLFFQKIYFIIDVLEWLLLFPYSLWTSHQSRLFFFHPLVIIGTGSWLHSVPLPPLKNFFFFFFFFFPESDKQQYHSIERKQGATNIIRKPFSPEFLIYWSIGFFAYINLKHCAAYVLLYNVKTKTAYTVYRQI